MARLMTKQDEARADKDLQRLQAMPLRNALLATLRLSAGDVRKYPARRKELTKALIGSLHAVLEDKHDPDSGEELVAILGFLLMYGRLPKPSEINGLDFASVRTYFAQKYPEDVCGPAED